MKTINNYGVQDWAKIALKYTLRAANVKDWKLTRKHDRQMKEIAQGLALGRGYIIATAFELESKFPGLFSAHGVDSKKMIWAVSFAVSSMGNKMSFMPIR